MRGCGYIEIPKDFLIKEYTVLQKSITDISKEFGYSMSTVRLRLKEYGLLRTHKEAALIALPKILLKTKGRKKEFSERHLKNMRNAALKRRGIGAGISLKPNGYYEVTMGVNKGKMLHVVVYEEYYGIVIGENEVIHHINGIRSDNRIENLQLMTRSEHCSHHAKLRQSLGLCYDISKETRLGEDHLRTKLTELQVKFIRESSLPIKTLIETMGVSKGAIYAIKKGRNWKHLIDNHNDKQDFSNRECG